MLTPGQYTEQHCSIVKVSAVQGRSVQHSKVLCQQSPVEFNVESWHSVQCKTAVKNSAEHYSAVRCFAVQCSSVQFSAVQCSAMQSSIRRPGILLSLEFFLLIKCKS